MWCQDRALLALGFLAAVGTAAPAPNDSQEGHVLKARNIVEKAADAYDFVIVGGGLAGLVLGNRLSEDSNHTVLVLEAGPGGDEYRERIDTPGDSYYQSLWSTPLNWAFTTVPQTAANNTECPWPRGKTLGGSSAINGLYLNRPGEIEVNAWVKLLGDMDGADNWSWESFYAAMKKSENFTPPSEGIAQQAGIEWDVDNHGSSGPIHYSYPGFTFPLNGQWSESAQSAGVDIVKDPYGGENWGAYVSASAINPFNWTRSYSRSGYLDPLPPRQNYDVLVSAQVTRILFNDTSAANLTANAVEYTPDNGTTKLTVKVKKEVILAGGSVGSPTVLLYSGIGPKDVLTAAGVEVVSELPGVGQHLQDHISVSTQWTTDQDTAGSIYSSNTSESTNPSFLSYVPDAVAYVNSTTFFGDAVSSIQSTILDEINDYMPTSPGASDETVIAGYKAIYNTTAETIFPSPLGLIELLIGNNLEGKINIGASLQHPLSHGSIWINSSNPLDYPVIDPGYLKHPVDLQILRAGLKLVRQIGNTNPLKSSMTNETWPGPDVQTDDEWDNWLRPNIFTEYHPSSSCAMLPLSLGGVVNAQLKVYGTSNVRVADASVPPTSFSAHLMGSTYGLAERASTIIRQSWNLKSTNTTNHHNSTSSATSTATATARASSTSSGDMPNKTNGAATATMYSWTTLLLAGAGLGMQLML
ncbi:hypothetical protein DV736_g5964, partial [Chaetothyriales sp. CBS 134916]